MPQEFDVSAQAHIDRDNQGRVRSVLHFEQPYRPEARTPQLAADAYLQRFSGLLGLSESELSHLSLALRREPTDEAPDFRLWSEKTQFDTTTVTFSQACLGLPVWEAGVAVTMKANPLRIVSAQSTAHDDVNVRKPSRAEVSRLLALDEGQLASSLGLTAKDKAFDRASLKIERRRLYVYRYEDDKRVRDPEEVTAEPARPGGAHVHRHQHENPPLPPVPPDIENGRHYVVAAVYFVLGVPNIPNLHWVALIESKSSSVLMLRALIAGVDGLVFKQDPSTTAGGPLPSATDAALNPLRSAVLLKKLDPPAGGDYALIGNLIQLQDVEPPPIPAPVEPVGTDFDFNARTWNFAAANAYYHADSFFRLVKNFGFDLNVYFGGTIFPTVVDHAGDGGIANAHCLGNGAFGILQTTFGLADLTNTAQPLGIACDQRVVLHELAGHGTLYNHVNGPNFGFSHSAGDTVAAVLNDPDSKAADRFESFPWMYWLVQRRQDRTPAAGWGWEGLIALNPFSGLYDSGGYNNEQILCTTHFRLYRAIGGDSTELAMRTFAGHYVAYLILRTIGGLTQPTNPPNAAVYAGFLMAAEQGDWTAKDQIGGCYWKVIRWAFEKQGLYQPPGTPTPNNNVGAPPPIDVYIDDGRHGEYTYGPANQYPYLQRFWETTDVWNRHHPDGHLEHQTPIVGRRNYAYARVKNRGSITAANVVVSGWHCEPSAGLVWPDDFRPMTTASIVVPSLPAGGAVVAGPLEWRPETPGHELMFMSATVPGDRANNDAASGIPAAVGPTPLWRLVPCDNNLALRALIPVPGGGGRKALEEAFEGRQIHARNPFATTAEIEVRPVLSAFLSSRGWAIKLDNPGGGSFSLGPRGHRVIHPRMIGGQDFSAAELHLAGEVTITLVVLANGLVVGGLTYWLDPNLHHPPHEFPEEPHEHHHEEARHERRERRDGEARHIKLEFDID